MIPCCIVLSNLPHKHEPRFLRKKIKNTNVPSIYYFHRNYYIYRFYIHGSNWFRLL